MSDVPIGTTVNVREVQKDSHRSKRKSLKKKRKVEPQMLYDLLKEQIIISKKIFTKNKHAFYLRNCQNISTFRFYNEL